MLPNQGLRLMVYKNDNYCLFQFYRKQKKIVQRKTLSACKHTRNSYKQPSKPMTYDKTIIEYKNLTLSHTASEICCANTTVFDQGHTKVHTISMQCGRKIYHQAAGKVALAVFPALLFWTCLAKLVSWA